MTDSGDKALNLGENPSEDGQSENKETNNSEEESSEQEISQNKSEQKEDKTEEETVEIPKEKFESMESDLENYRNMAKSQNRKDKELPGGDSEEPDEINEDNVVTKEELRKRNEENAIAMAAKDESMPGLEENWDEVVSHFNEDTSRDSTLNVLGEIESAYHKWRKKNPEKVKKESNDSSKQAKSKLASDKSISKGESGESSESDSDSSDDSILLGNRESMEDWYSDEEDN